MENKFLKVYSLKIKVLLPVINKHAYNSTDIKRAKIYYCFNPILFTDLLLVTEKQATYSGYWFVWRNKVK